MNADQIRAEAYRILQQSTRNTAGPGITPPETDTDRWRATDSERRNISQMAATNGSCQLSLTDCEHTSELEALRKMKAELVRITEGKSPGISREGIAAILKGCNDGT